MPRGILDPPFKEPTMFKGKTKIDLSKATMIAAVQMYLDATFKESHVVTDVKSVSTGYGSDTFTVEIDDGAEAAKAA